MSFIADSISFYLFSSTNQYLKQKKGIAEPSYKTVNDKAISY